MATFIRHHVHPADAADLSATLDRLFAADGVKENIRFRVAGPSRTWCDIEGVGRNLLGDEAVRSVLLNLRDVSERTELEYALTQHAFTDPLTGLPNRTLLHDRAEQALRAGGAGTGTRPRCCSSTSTGSRRSTTPSATTTATCCCSEIGRAAARRAARRRHRRPPGRRRVRRPAAARSARPTARSRSPSSCGAALDAPFRVEGLTLDVERQHRHRALPGPRRRRRRAAAARRRGDVRRQGRASAGSRSTTPSCDQHSPRRLAPARRAAPGDRARASSCCTTSPRSTSAPGGSSGVEALVRWQHPERGLRRRPTSSSRSPSTPG